jgi:hypothetical protein
MHGGLSPDLNSMEQIRRVMRPTDVSSAISFACLLSLCRGRARAHTDFIRSPTAVFSAISYGLIQTRISLAGVRMTEVFRSRSVPMSYLAFFRNMIWI